jgi:predicted lipid-binding transport protein (Tim44 family)
MRKLLAVFVALIGFSLAMDVDARRMGGGRSIGKQRESVNQNQATQRSQNPQQQQQAAPAQQQQAAPAATPPAKQASGFSRWLGPLAGLAIGAALASLFFNNGLGGALLGILLLAALVLGAVMLFRLIRGARPAREPRYAGPDPYVRRESTDDAYVRREPTNAPPAVTPSGAAAPHSVAATTQGSYAAPTPTRAPLDFDAEQFLRHARKHFLELQAAHDRKDLAAIRDFLTPELYREIEAEVRASGDTPQKTDVVTLDADVLDVTTENDAYVVSVRFSGLIREQPGAEPQPFSEIWHLEKPVNGRSGWLVSGIQQS